MKHNEDISIIFHVKNHFKLNNVLKCQQDEKKCEHQQHLRRRRFKINLRN